MSLKNEIWFQKIIARQNGFPCVFQCKKTKIEIPFEIDENKIREYTDTQFPKWINGEKYHLISRRSWGLGKYICLYVDDVGETFVIESTY
jgi:hypothetical protein